MEVMATRTRVLRMSLQRRWQNIQQVLWFGADPGYYVLEVNTKENKLKVSPYNADHAVHNRVVGHTQLHALQIIDGCNGLDGEEVTEALLAVEQAANGQALIYR